MQQLGQPFREVFQENLTQCLQQGVGVFHAEAQRRLDLDDIATRPIGREQHPARAHARHDNPIGNVGCGHLGGLAHDDLHADEQPPPADVPHHRRSGCQLLQLPEKVAPDALRIGLQALLTNHVEHSRSRNTCSVAATVAVEVLHAIGEFLRHVPCGHSRTHRETVADALAERHDVRDDSFGLESPERAARSPKAGLCRRRR
mmetsp:Transcript_7169/g.17196  ORF Transcript_7169/g.17196 Transcript_7169/m.17196 type:complete len:202 (-) Transcript_7169:45-650(-)